MARSFESLGDAKANNNCDANNNASGSLAALAAESSRLREGGEQAGLPSDCLNVRSETSADQRARRGNLSDRASSTSTDDWHLLDVDERSSISSSSSSSLVSGERDNSSLTKVTRGSKSKSKSESRTRNKMELGTFESSSSSNKGDESSVAQSNGAKFIVIDNQKERERLSPTLVHLCTGLYSLMPLASLATFATFIYLLLFTKLWFITVIYYSYLLLDSKTCNRGGRRWDLVYRSKFWTYLAAHFPIRLKFSRNFELNPSENYILNYHPHGISAFGCVTAFATNGLGFSELFPGIRSRFMVHETSFLVPVMRETFGLRGDCSVNSASFDFILSKKWQQQQGRAEEPKQSSEEAADAAGSGACNQRAPASADSSGNLLALCGGGLAEADLSDMETLNVVCATRKGFVKKAIIHGAHLVPCIAFGENSVFKKVNLKEGSLLRRLESKWYQLFKFKHPIYYGTSFFGGGSRLRGVMPFKRPITVCMADPIRVERVAEPSQQEIDRVHALYMERLTSLYKDNRDLCDEYDRKLQLL